MAQNEEVKSVKLSIYLPEEMRANFKSACALHRKSMNQVLVDYINEFLKENEATGVNKDSKGVA
ncbi:MAG: plasmid partition protein ParG [Cyanobacteria bacterium P01_D01_bin.116]